MAYSLCTTSVSNLGEQECDPARGVGSRFLIGNGTFGSGDYATPALLFAKLITNSKLSKNETDKIFSIPELQDIVNNSEANKEGTLGLGFSATLVEGKPKYTVKFFAGADRQKRLRSWNNKRIRIFEYDKNGVLWGTKSGTNFIGFSAQLFFSGDSLATGQNVEEGVCTLTVSILSNSEYKDNAYWASSAGLTFNIDDVVGLLDVTTAYVSKASNVYKYSMKIPGSNIVGPYDVLPAIGDILDGLTFTAKSGAGVPATPLTITSVANNVSSDGLFTVTYDSTMHTAAVGNITLTPPTPPVLDAA